MTEKDRKKAFIVALTKLAIRRQAEVDTSALTIYAEDLVADAHDDSWLLEACDDLGMAPRKEFETAFPPVGNILEKAEMLRRQDVADRRRQAQIEADETKQLPELVSKSEAMEWLSQIRLAAHGRGGPHD